MNKSEETAKMEKKKSVDVESTRSLAIFKTDADKYDRDITAMSVTFKVLCECKQYSKPVGRDKVAELHSKLESIGGT